MNHNNKCNSASPLRLKLYALENVHFEQIHDSHLTADNYLYRNVLLMLPGMQNSTTTMMCHYCSSAILLRVRVADTALRRRRESENSGKKSDDRRFTRTHSSGLTPWLPSAELLWDSATSFITSIIFFFLLHSGSSPGLDRN